MKLVELYTHLIGKQGFAPEDLPDTLFYTFGGDILGSCGAHYKKGFHIPFDSAVVNANLHFSDDFSESLAMAQLYQKRWAVDLPSLMQGRDEFLNIIRKHYEAYGQQYSPWAAALFEEKDIKKYGVLLAYHDSCGAAMRAAALSPFSLSAEDLLPFFLITHANLQAIEGAYMVYGFALHAAEGKGFEYTLAKALEWGEQGRALCNLFIQNNNLPIVRDDSVKMAIDITFSTNDPYQCLKGNLDGVEENQNFISTYFVVASAFYILRNIATHNPVNGVRYVTEQSLKIGGDPDTICSVTMSLYGALYPQRAKQELQEVSGLRQVPCPSNSHQP